MPCHALSCRVVSCLFSWQLCPVSDRWRRTVAAWCAAGGFTRDAPDGGELEERVEGDGLGAAATRALVQQVSHG